MNTIAERNAIIHGQLSEKISKKLPVFYNPIMIHNRDISILLLAALRRKSMQLCDPLAGSGIRAIRFIQELPPSSIKSLTVNDYSKSFKTNFKKNAKLSKIKLDKLQILDKDANIMLAESTGFDYIDIDPFGTPNPFLDNAIKRISRDGILAITATDTSSLAGAFPRVCRRNYYAEPLHNYLMHEVGLRILIRKVQLIGSQYEKALIPIFSFSKDHYYRVFFSAKKSKSACDLIISQHSFLTKTNLEVAENRKVLAGPAYTGRLFDPKVAKNMATESKKRYNDQKLTEFLSKIYKESLIPVVGFYDIHELVSELKLGSPPKLETVLKTLKAQGFKSSPTHISPTGIRSDAKYDNVAKVLLSLSK